MSVNIKYENTNNNSDNIVPLGNSEIKSILKAQSEAIFIEEKKMISNNSGFTKKTLIDLAIEFENKVLKTKSDDNNDIKENVDDANQLLEIKNKDEIDQSSIEENIIDSSIVDDKNLKENIDSDNNQDATDTLKSDEINTNEIPLDQDLQKIDNKAEVIEKKNENITETSLETDAPKIEETEQALNSVRDAVSKSINNQTDNNDLGINDLNQNDTFKNINQDIDYFKNIFSALSNLTEKVIHENIENKIIEIASELAGYQIDKMPDKYEKKIKTFLKNINRFDEKMTIETNDKDYEALLKIENFKNMNETIQFTPNSAISRGDIILNCDGMYYSEKTIKNN